GGTAADVPQRSVPGGGRAGLGHPEGFWRDRHAGPRSPARQIAGREARRQVCGLDARPRRRDRGPLGQDGGFPGLLYRRRCEAAVAGDRARWRYQLSDAGRGRQGRRHQLRRARPYLESLEDADRSLACEVTSPLQVAMAWLSWWIA